MMCYSPMVFFEVLSGLMILAAHAVATEVIPTKEPIKDNYIVLYSNAMKSQVKKKDIMNLINGGAASTFEGNGNELLYMYNVIPGFAARLSPQGRENLLNSELIEGVYEDGIVRATTETSEWGLDRIDERYLPLDTLYNPSSENNGEDVTAYVIDTGINDSHEDFEGRAVQEENFSGDNINSDCNGHGTHVAGTIGGKTYGVAKKSTLVGLKVFGCGGSGSWSDVIAALDWVKDNHTKPAVVNMSLGGDKSTPLNNAVKNLVVYHRIPVVTSAGNDSVDACNKSPAMVSEVITVGSTYRDDARSYFSNWGTCVNIFAPGSNIKSTWIGSDTATNTMGGTSMASPHVCGAVALYLSDNQGLSTDDVHNKLLGDATDGAIHPFPNDGSPNKLLYVGEIGPVMPDYIRFKNRARPSLCLSYRTTNGTLYAKNCDTLNDEQFWFIAKNGFLMNKTGGYVNNRLKVVEGTPDSSKDVFVYNGFHRTLIHAANTPRAMFLTEDRVIKLVQCLHQDSGCTANEEWDIVQ